MAVAQSSSPTDLVQVGAVTGSRNTRSGFSHFVVLDLGMSLARGDQVAFTNPPDSTACLAIDWLMQSGQSVSQAHGQSKIEIGLSSAHRLIPSGTPVFKLSCPAI